MDAVFAKYNTTDAPGCAVGTYRNGELTYARGYGLADLERRVPIAPTTIFDIGSTSKQFTAAVIVLLAQEGKLSLDDAVRRFLPELPAYQRPITIRHLLNHTSGIRDYLGLLRLAGYRYDDVTTPADALQAIVRQRALNFAPGDEYLYSNSGFFLLSQIVERITGRSLRDEARDHLFAPLGMTRTAYLGHYNDIVPNRAIGYAPADSGFEADMPRWLQLGDGAVLTSVTELAKWVGNFEQPRVGGTALRDTLETRGRLANGFVMPYALGLIHGDLRRVPIVTHGGSWGGYRAELLRVPSQRYGVAVLCNRSDTDPSALALQVATAQLADVLPADSVPVLAIAPGDDNHGTQAPVRPLLPSHQLVGSYRAPGGAEVLTIVAEGDSLRLTEPRPYGLRPAPEGGLALVGPAVRVRLVFEPGSTPDAPAPRVAVYVNDRLDRRYERFTPMAATREAMQPMVGRYRSAELATTMELVWTDAGLQLVARNAEPAPLRSLDGDQFTANGLLLRATRDAAGHVTGFTLTQGRIRELGFVRE